MIFTRIKPALFGLGFAIIIFTDGLAQINKFPPDRDLVKTSYYEGMRSFTDVSSAVFKLKSFTSQTTSNNNSAVFNMRWVVPDNLANTDLELFVESRSNDNYYIQPTQKRWSSGVQSFSWDGSRLAIPNGVSVDDLIGVVKSTTSKDLIPLTFYDGDKPGATGDYEFIFISNLTVSGKITLFDQNENVLKDSSFQNQIRNSPLAIRFEKGLFSTGKYYLLVEYFANSGGELIQDSDTYTFYHP